MNSLINQYAMGNRTINMIKPYKLSKICIYIFVIYIMFYVYLFGVKLSILYGSIALATSFILFEAISKKEDIRKLCPSGILINIIMCLYSILTGLFFARNQQILIDTIKTYACFSIVCFDICYISKKEKSIDWLLDCIIIICLISSIYIIMRGSFVPGYGYILSPSQNPNLLGLIMDLGIFGVAYKSIKNKKRIIINVGLALLFLYTIIQCGSRKCLISAIILCALWCFTFSKILWNKGDKYKIAVIILIGIIVFFAQYYYSHEYINTYSYNRMEVLGSSTVGSSSQVRSLYYVYAFNYFLEHPIFGIGLGQFAVWNPMNGYSHSSYAEMLADWGFVGSVIYLIPIIVIGIRLLKTSIMKEYASVARMVLALWVMEVFLGVGQIWFYEIEHMIAWSFVYLYYDIYIKEYPLVKERTYKYVKTENND